MAPAPSDPGLIAVATPDAPPRFPDLWRRVASAAVLIPFGLACIWYAPAWDALMILAAAGLLRELRRLTLPRAMTLPGAALIVLAALTLIWLRERPLTGYTDIMFTAVVVWVDDIAAYAAGRAFGGRKLAPTVSPAKTVSGALGGLLASVATGAAFALPTAPLAGACAALVLAAVAQAGDLAESAAKRAAGVKDTGSLIPGHGGLLDRLDGMLAAAPIAALLAWIAGPGAPLWAALR